MRLSVGELAFNVAVMGAGQEQDGEIVLRIVRESRGQGDFGIGMVSMLLEAILRAR